MRALLCEKCTKEWESNLKSSLQVLFLSRIFDFDALFYRMDTSHRWVLAILTIKKGAFQSACGVKCGNFAADTVAVEVCPSTAPIP